MTRKQKRYLSVAAVIAAIVTVGLLLDPTALFAAPFVLGMAAGAEGDDGEADGGTDSGSDSPDDDPGDDGEGEDADAEGDEDDDPDNPAADAAGNKGKGKDRMVPAYRLRQLRESFARQLAEIRQGEGGRTRQLLEKLQSVFGGGPGGGQGPALTPQQQKLRGQFMELFPEFGDLLKLSARSQDLIGLADRAPEWDRDTDQYWDRVAQSTKRRLNAQAATEFGVKKLDADTENVLRDSFIAWVKGDRTGERNHRYEGQDESLIGDFLSFFKARFGVGSARGVAANALRRAAAPVRVPRGGGSATNLPPAPKKKKPRGEDEDPFEEVGSRAWTALQDEIGGG